MTLANPIKLVTLGPHGLLSRTKESTTLSKTANNGACNKLTLISLISLTESRWRWTSGDFKSVFVPRVPSSCYSWPGSIGYFTTA